MKRRSGKEKTINQGNSRNEDKIKRRMLGRKDDERGERIMRERERKIYIY